LRLLLPFLLQRVLLLCSQSESGPDAVEDTPQEEPGDENYQNRQKLAKSRIRHHISVAYRECCYGDVPKCIEEVRPVLATVHHLWDLASLDGQSEAEEEGHEIVD